MNLPVAAACVLDDLGAASRGARDLPRSLNEAVDAALHGLAVVWVCADPTGHQAACAVLQVLCGIDPDALPRRLGALSRDVRERLLAAQRLVDVLPIRLTAPGELHHASPLWREADLVVVEPGADIDPERARSWARSAARFEVVLLSPPGPIEWDRHAPGESRCPRPID